MSHTITCACCVFNKGNSPYFLKCTRQSVHKRALSLPAWCQSFDAATNTKIHLELRRKKNN